MTLQQLQRSRTIVPLERTALEKGHARGRIVGSSRKLVAVALISDAIRPDGFNVFRRVDILRARQS